MKIRVTIAMSILVLGVLAALLCLRRGGLPVRVTQLPYVGRFLHDHIGTRMVIREDGRVIQYFVARGYSVPPPPPGYVGFWNVLPSPRIVRGESYNTNGVVVASVRGGRGSVAVFNHDGSLRSIVTVSNGMTVEQSTEQEAQQRH